MVLMKSIIVFCQLLLSLHAINLSFMPCDVNENITEVDCFDRNLDRVIYIKEPRVLFLNLSFNRIHQIKRYTFSGVPNLHTLDMERNRKFFAAEMNIHYYAFQILPHLKSLNLSQNQLTQIPWLPEGLLELVIEKNRIFHIENPFNTPNLQILSLEFNCFYQNPCAQPFYIAENVLQQLTTLKDLKLGYNNLSAIPRGLPPSLERLDFRDTRLTEIPDRAFVNLTKLRYLNLEWNCQRCDHAKKPCFPCLHDLPLQLHPNSFFTENSSIYFLKLSGNSLTTFPKGIFQPLKKLKRLDISNNRLAKEIQTGSFFKELTGLNWISLIYNYDRKVFHEFNLSSHIGNMAGLEYLLLSGNFFYSLSDQALDVLSRLKKLRTVELRMNFIDKSDLPSFKRIPSLRRVDLSQNMLSFHRCPSRELKNQSELILQSQNLISSALKNAYSPMSSESYSSKMPHLNCFGELSVDLSHNDILYLTKEVLAGLENVICLDLSLNYMSQSLKGGVFTDMTKLRVLNMSHNRLNLYHNYAFKELSGSLKVLDLSYNDFHFRMQGMVHRLTFIQNLKNLEVLYLANNVIGVLIDQRLNSSSLRSLYFGGNCLNEMWKTNDKYSHFFQNLTNLKLLDISNNQLKFITEEIFINFPKSLESLIISNNQLVFFPWANLSALSNLTFLDLSHNSLQFFPQTVLEIANLKRLYLNYNRFTRFSDSVMTQLRSLQILHLDHNQFKEIDFKYVPKPNYTTLLELTLDRNPFRCNCDTSSFSSFLALTSIRIPRLLTAVHCSYPESLNGYSVLRIDQRSCQDIYGGLAFFVSFCLVIVLTVLPLLKHLYGWDLWYSLQVFWAGQKGYSQLPGSDYPYHAFVVFDTSNPAVSDWVYNELILHLEDRKLSLCLEERDWVPGLSCIENLHNAVYKSVKTVFVLSSVTALSGVVRQAFYMVQQRLLDEKADVAVLVLLEDMHSKLKYLQLRKRLCGKSVLTWPKNPLAQPLFWNKMKTALLSDNVKLYDKNMSESFNM